MFNYILLFKFQTPDTKNKRTILGIIKDEGTKILALFTYYVHIDVGLNLMLSAILGWSDKK